MAILRFIAGAIVGFILWIFTWFVPTLLGLAQLDGVVIIQFIHLILLVISCGIVGAAGNVNSFVLKILLGIVLLPSIIMVIVLFTPVDDFFIIIFFN